MMVTMGVVLGLAGDIKTAFFFRFRVFIAAYRFLSPLLATAILWAF
jgi:hypothetical protein